MPDPSLRLEIANGTFINAPGVFDLKPNWRLIDLVADLPHAAEDVEAAMREK